ncbi:MAG TPA: hypothetical protein VH144_01375 [Candidatus Saccharimonadales bacterium]|nr:hypothetical protein [Candidatus Saccharimonadales bacterium]
MVHNIQHSHSNSDELRPQQQKQNDAPVSFHLNEQATLDDNEAKERHGGQYHLRHHLSGCAQTLHTIDFANDFSPPVLEQPALTAQIHAELTTGSTSTPVTEFIVAAEMTPLPLALATGEVSSASITATSGQQSALLVQAEAIPPDAIQTHAEQHASSQVATVTSVDNAELTATEIQSESTAISTPLVANFDDLSLNGWTLGGSLTAEQIVEDGHLHFTAQSLQEGEPLLSNTFVLSENQHYAFQMSLLGDENAEQPHFMLNINGENHEMNVSREGNHFVIKAEFIASSSEKVNMAVIPVNVASLKQDIWLDDFILKPTIPTSAQPDIPFKLAVLPAEPVFEFNEIAALTPPPDPTLETSLKISMVLNTAGPEMFEVVPPSPSEPFLTPVLEDLLDAAQPQMWNQSAAENTSAGLIVATETTATIAFDEMDMNHISNQH